MRSAAAFQSIPPAGRCRLTKGMWSGPPAGMGSAATSEESARTATARRTRVGVFIVRGVERAVDDDDEGVMGIGD